MAPRKVGRPDNRPGVGLSGYIGQRLREVRKDMGLTLKAAAARTGGHLTFRTWSLIELGGERSLTTYLVMLAVLGASIGDIMPSDLACMVAGPVPDVVTAETILQWGEKRATGTRPVGSGSLGVPLITNGDLPLGAGDVSLESGALPPELPDDDTFTV